MEKKLRKKSIGRICALAMIGIFMVMTSMSVPATDPNDWTKDGNSWGADARLGPDDNYAVIFETNGNDRMTITNGGNVGIGTTNPTAQLELSKTTGDPTLVFDIHGTDVWSISVDDSQSDHFIIQTPNINVPMITGNYSTANVGIGTANAKGRLNIDSTSGSKGLGVIFDTYDVQTTDATVTTIATISTETDKAYGLTVTTIGIKSDGSQAAHYVRHLTYRNDAGTVYAVGSVASAHTAEDDINWDVTFTISGTDILVKVTGAAATTIQWQTTVEKNIVGV